jgi:exodeoxyribonuclease VII large subunit
VRAATPSNAAEIVVERADHVRARIDRARERLRTAASFAAHRRAVALDRAETRLRRWPVAVVLRDRDVRQLALRLRHAAGDRVTRMSQRFDHWRRRLERADRRRVLADLATRLSRADGRLRAAVRLRRLAGDGRVRELAARLDALSPLAVLGRGYALCWNADRTSIIRSATAVGPGDGVRVTLAEGELACRVETS